MMDYRKLNKLTQVIRSTVLSVVRIKTQKPSLWRSKDNNSKRFHKICQDRSNITCPKMFSLHCCVEGLERYWNTTTKNTNLVRKESHIMIYICSSQCKDWDHCGAWCFDLALPSDVQSWRLENLWFIKDINTATLQFTRCTPINLHYNTYISHTRV